MRLIYTELEGSTSRSISLPTFVGLSRPDRVLGRPRHDIGWRRAQSFLRLRTFQQDGDIECFVDDYSQS